MNFYEVSFPSKQPPSGASFPCAILISDRWNDFGYVTMWDVIVFRSPGVVVMQGSVKILQRRPDDTGEAVRHTHIPASFEALTEDYCSLGQSLEYYQKLSGAGREIFEPFFVGLRDAAIYPGIAAQFQQMEGFRESLVRFSEAEKAFREAASIFTHVASDRLYAFKFRCKVPGAERSHDVDFDFSEHPTDLHRTTVIIGRNGTGKTQFLAQFALFMSGLWRGTEAGDGFEPRRPSFSKVIAVSYSVFDDFRRPPENDRTFSYKYCGIRAPDPDVQQAGDEVPAELGVGQQARFLSPAELKDRLMAALMLVRTNVDRQGRWREIVNILLEQTLEISDEDIENLGFYDRLSSGQRILVAIMTEIIANIEPESIILFDEPELHLHPEVFAALARAFDRLLTDFDSYAIIATHSSLLLQETLAKQVRIFRRIGNYPVTEPLTVESFGENLSTITREVFSVDGAKHNFRAHLEKLLQGHTIEEVSALFPLGLPLQAMAYLRALATEDNR